MITSKMSNTEDRFLYEPVGTGSLESWWLVLSLPLVTRVTLVHAKHTQNSSRDFYQNSSRDFYLHVFSAAQCRIEKMLVKAGVRQVEAFLCMWGDITGA